MYVRKWHSNIIAFIQKYFLWDFKEILLMHQILGYYLCSIELILLKLGKRARAALAPYICFVAQVLVYFKDMFNKYFIKINLVFSTLN
jgi:hypothetical protein